MTTRRNFMAASALPALADDEVVPAVRFSDRAHIFARPSAKEKLTWCFSAVLGCGKPISLNAQSLSQPILAFRFPAGGSLSVEFTSDAPDDRQARRGAWLEIQTSDPAALTKKVLDAGFAQMHYPATNTFYFQAPGGQILGIVSSRNPSAGELRAR